MNNSDELCVMFICDQTEIRPVVKKIIASLPSLTITPVDQTRNGTHSHYEDTDDIKTLSRIILNNVSHRTDRRVKNANRPQTRSKITRVSSCASKSRWPGISGQPPQKQKGKFALMCRPIVLLLSLRYPSSRSRFQWSRERRGKMSRTKSRSSRLPIPILFYRVFVFESGHRAGTFTWLFCS